MFLAALRAFESPRETGHRSSEMETDSRAELKVMKSVRPFIEHVLGTLSDLYRSYVDATHRRKREELYILIPPKELHSITHVKTHKPTSRAVQLQDPSNIECEIISRSLKHTSDIGKTCETTATQRLAHVQKPWSNFGEEARPFPS